MIIKTSKEDQEGFKMSRDTDIVKQAERDVKQTKRGKRKDNLPFQELQ